jgi:DNA polymerase
VPVATNPPPAAPPRAPAASPPPMAASLFEESGFETPPVPAADRPAILAACAAEVAQCTRCPHLASTRTQTVFGTGTPTARLMFIGEAPGADEDRIGQPFVGRAGQLLTDMITKGMGLRREDVYIANVLKCRPPDNRTPTTEEAANCSSYLDQQIAVIRPEFLCLLGKTAAIALLDIPETTGMRQLRKRWHRVKGIQTLVTYHPSYLLRTESAKKDAWEDLQILMKEMGLPIPGKRGKE